MYKCRNVDLQGQNKKQTEGGDTFEMRSHLTTRARARTSRNEAISWLPPPHPPTSDSYVCIATSLWISIVTHISMLYVSHIYVFYFHISRVPGIPHFHIFISTPPRAHISAWQNFSISICAYVYISHFHMSTFLHNDIPILLNLWIVFMFLYYRIYK